LREGAVSELIDAIVQTAFYNGRLGQTIAESHSVKEQLPQVQTYVKRPEFEFWMVHSVLDWVTQQSSDPMQFIKALLCRFVMQSQRRSQVEASEILGVTRQTLRNHLHEAKKLNIDSMFTKAL
jgi:DNA-binding protein Fis